VNFSGWISETANRGFPAIFKAANLIPVYVKKAAPVVVPVSFQFIRKPPQDPGGFMVRACFESGVIG
jgi:hypothetical protein